MRRAWRKTLSTQELRPEDRKGFADVRDPFRPAPNCFGSAKHPVNATLFVTIAARSRRDTPLIMPTPDPEIRPPAEAPDDERSGLAPECKRVLAVLTALPEWLPERVRILEASFGPVDYRSAFVPFSDDAYYAAEMGGPLWRGWLSFRGSVSPRDLPAWKRRARELEAQWAVAGRRSWNLDIGYLDSDKLVLASFKRGPLKLYLDQGVWADVILGYSQGAFQPAPRTFPDFRDGRYDKYLKVIREKMKAEMRAEGRR
jgi:hypothetical protein